MSTSEDALTIINLPHDVIRTIIRLGQDDIDIMMLISPQWKALTTEHLNNKKHLPVLEYFCWRTNGDGQIKLTMRMPNRFRTYFKVENWNSRPDMIIDSGDLLFSAVPTEQILNRIFNRCSRINNFEIDVDVRHSNGAIQQLENIMIGLTIEKLAFKRNLSLDALDAIMDLICSAKIKLLILFQPQLLSRGFDAIFPALYRFVRHVSAIELTSRVESEVQQLQNPFLQQLQLLQQLRQRYQQQLQQVVQLRDQDADQNRVEWRKFNDLLNGTDKVAATFDEETLPNGKVRFFIIMQAKK